MRAKNKTAISLGLIPDRDDFYCIPPASTSYCMLTAIRHQPKQHNRISDPTNAIGWWDAVKISGAPLGTPLIFNLKSGKFICPEGC
jgi:hypothetical protein